jgi:hypothetical protein
MFTSIQAGDSRSSTLSSGEKNGAASLYEKVCARFVDHKFSGPTYVRNKLFLHCSFFVLFSHFALAGDLPSHKGPPEEGDFASQGSYQVKGLRALPGDLSPEHFLDGIFGIDNDVERLDRQSPVSRRSSGRPGSPDGSSPQDLRAPARELTGRRAPSGGSASNGAATDIEPSTRGAPGRHLPAFSEGSSHKHESPAALQ